MTKNNLLAFVVKEKEEPPYVRSVPLPPASTPAPEPDSGPGMRGYVALQEGDPAVNYGRLFWFSVREFDAQATDFLATAQTMLPEKFHPGPIHFSDAFSRALNDVALAKLTTLAPSGGEHPVTFTRDRAPDAPVETWYITAVFHPPNRPPEHHIVAVARLIKNVRGKGKTLTVDYEAEFIHANTTLAGMFGDMETKFHERIKWHRNSYNADHLRGVIGRAIKSWDSYMARPTGGVYVALEKYAAELVQVQNFARHYGGQLWAVPLARTAESRDLILTTYEEQTVKDIRLILPALQEMEEQGTVDEAKLKDAMRRLEGWRSSKELYEKELQATMKTVATTLEFAEAKVADLLPLLKPKATKATPKEQGTL